VSVNRRVVQKSRFSGKNLKNEPLVESVFRFGFHDLKLAQRLSGFSESLHDDSSLSKWLFSSEPFWLLFRLFHQIVD
jgi:hypothetical protein